LAVVGHSFNGKHCIQLKGTKILSTKAEYMDWIMKDAVEIENRLNNINMEDGLVLSRTWIPLVHSLKDWRNPPHEDTQQQHYSPFQDHHIQGRLPPYLCHLDRPSQSLQFVIS
jgi:hypothetical protein